MLSYVVIVLSRNTERGLNHVGVPQKSAAFSRDVRDFSLVVV